MTPNNDYLGVSKNGTRVTVKVWFPWEIFTMFVLLAESIFLIEDASHQLISLKGMFNRKWIKILILVIDMTLFEMKPSE